MSKLSLEDPMEDLRKSVSQCCNVSTTIQDLPNELLEHIFCFLNVKERLQTESVCRRWREIGTTISWSWPTTLNVLDLKEELNVSLTDDVLLAVLSRCGNSLKEVVLSVSEPVSPASLILTDKAFDIVAENCPNLQIVSLARRKEKGDIFSGQCLTNVAKRCKKLKRVCLNFGDSLRPDTLSNFLQQCVSPEWILLDSNYAIGDEWVESIKGNLKGFYMKMCVEKPATVAEKLLRRRDGIEELSICHPSLDTSTLMKILHHYKNTLKSLYLQHYVLEPQELCEIPNILMYLEELSVSSCSGVNGRFLKILAEKCKKLKSLDIGYTRVTDDGISALASLQLLTGLDVRGSGISGEGLQNLARQGRLERVYYTDVRPNSNSRSIEDSCISLAKCCSNLRLLDVTGNKNISNKLVEEFSASFNRGSVKGPVTLYVSDTKVDESVKYCDKLEVVFDFFPNYLLSLDDLFGLH